MDNSKMEGKTVNKSERFQIFTRAMHRIPFASATGLPSSRRATLRVTSSKLITLKIKLNPNFQSENVPSRGPSSTSPLLATRSNLCFCKRVLLFIIKRMGNAWIFRNSLKKISVSSAPTSSFRNLIDVIFISFLYIHFFFLFINSSSNFIQILFKFQIFRSFPSPFYRFSLKKTSSNLYLLIFWEFFC